MSWWSVYVYYDPSKTTRDRVEDALPRKISSGSGCCTRGLADVSWSFKTKKGAVSAKNALVRISGVHHVEVTEYAERGRKRMTFLGASFKGDVSSRRDTARTVWTVTWKVDGYAGTHAKTFDDKEQARAFLRLLGKRHSVYSVKLKPWRWSKTEQRRRRARKHTSRDRSSSKKPKSYGKRACKTGMTAQSYLLPKDRWTRARALAWAKKNAQGKIEDSKSYWRARRKNPSAMQKGKYATVPMKGMKGALMVLACPKKSARDPGPRRRLWIGKATRHHKGALRREAAREGAILADGTISVAWLKRASHHPGKIGRRARLALTLRGVRRGRHSK